MPAIADITVKKNDGVTNVTYVGKAGSGGDASPALWRFDAHPAPLNSLKPELRLNSKWNGPRTARRMEATYVYKGYVTDTTTGVSSSIGAIPVTLSAPIPMSMPQADIDEAVSQAVNLFASTLFKDCLKAGFAAT
jgi:hypothetical protein